MAPHLDSGLTAVLAAAGAMAPRGSLIALVVFLGCVAVATAQCIECNVSSLAISSCTIATACSLPPVPSYSTRKLYLASMRLRRHLHAAALCSSDISGDIHPSVCCCSTPQMCCTDPLLPTHHVPLLLLFSCSQQCKNNNACLASCQRQCPKPVTISVEVCKGYGTQAGRDAAKFACDLSRVSEHLLLCIGLAKRTSLVLLGA
jgi:hypothetical protein